MSLKQLSCIVGIPYKTFKKYVAQDSSKLHVCGNSVGYAPLVKRKYEYFLDVVLARKDQLNSGSSKAEAIDFVIEINLFPAKFQACKNLNRTLAPIHPEQLKFKIMAAQATTNKFSWIALGQNFYWYFTYEDSFNEIIKINTGV